MRTIIIGDVHGCHFELQELLQKCALREGDRLIFLGDLIQKGPDSAGVLHLVHTLSASHSVQVLIGNHDEKFLRYLHHRVHNPEAASQMTETADFEALAGQVSEAEIDVLRNGFYSLRIPEAGLLLLHAGVPATTKLDLDKRDFSYSADYSVDEKKALRLLIMTRHLTPKGDFVGLGKENTQTRFWAETYDGRFGKVIFGHQPFIQAQPMVFAHAIGLDTGCVYDGWLSAGILSGTELDFVCIKAKRGYARNPFDK